MNSLSAAFVKLTGITILTVLLGACGGGESGIPSSSPTSVPLPTAPGTGGTDPVVGTGSATLTWNPPTENTDGSALTNLAGYKIYYGTSNGSYPNVITINNVGTSTYMVENIPAGKTYYFVVTAFDTDGNESEYSNAVSKTITSS